MKFLKIAVLSLVLVAAPGCAELRADNPFMAARKIDQQAYALISAYADIVDTATNFLADPAAPPAAKRALGAAEAVATPAVETLAVAAVAYLQAGADARAAINGDG